MKSQQQIKILELLQDTHKEMTTKELQFHFGVSYQMITRHMRQLTDKKAVIRRIKAGSQNNEFSYRFREWPKDEREFSPIKPSEVRKMIAGYTKPEWQPLISKPEIYKHIKQVMLDLNGFNVAASQGDTIDQLQLDRSKLELRAVYEVVDKMRTVLGSLLSTDNIWDGKAINIYLNEG